MAQSPSIKGENGKMEGKIAVLQIVNKSMLKPEEISFLTTQVQSTVQLKTRGYYQVMTQENILQLLPPDKSLEDCEGECEVETGRLLGAQLIITGELVKFGNEKDNLRLSLKLHETQTGTLISTATIKGNSATDVEEKLKAATIQLISDGLRDLKSKEVESKIGSNQATTQENENTEDLSKQLDALEKSGQKSETSKGENIDYEAELKALEAENQKKEAHQKKVDQEWKQVNTIVAKGKKRQNRCKQGSCAIVHQPIQSTSIRESSIGRGSQKIE